MTFLIITSMTSLEILNSEWCRLDSVTNTNKYYHITFISPILQKLHWPPVREHVHIKILLITYKSIDDMASEYLCELIGMH